MQRRRAGLVLILSVTVAIGVVVYASSLDEWGETGGLVFPLVFLAALAVAATSALKLARASKHE